MTTQTTVSMEKIEGNETITKFWKNENTRDYEVWRFYCILENPMLNKAAKVKENGFTLRSRRLEFRDCLSPAI